MASPSILMRTGRLAIALAVLFALAGCRADVIVDVSVEEDGSGVVAVEVLADAEAASRLIDLRGDSSLQLADLADAGWQTVPPQRLDDGSMRVTARKPFGSPEQFSEIMLEISGTEGIFRDFSLQRNQSFGRVDYVLAGAIDPSNGFDSFGDDQIVADLGRGVGSIVSSAPYEATPDDVFVTLFVSMPGTVQEEGSNAQDPNLQTPEAVPVGRQSQVSAAGQSDAGAPFWTTNLRLQRIDVSLVTVRQSSTAQVLRGGAVVAGVLAVLLLFGRAVLAIGPLRRERPSPTVRRADALGRTADEIRAEAEAAEAAAEAEAGLERPIGARVVALDGPGVLYREGQDVEQLLVPFIREAGSMVPEADVAERVRLLSLGRITTPQFWALMEVPGEPAELDAAYVARHQLNQGVVRYLRTLRDRGIRVACITNDAAAWARLLRVQHNLEGLIDWWVVSGAVGVRKPDAALFEVLRRMTGESPASILVMDDNLDNLDAARSLGFSTRWFVADRPEEDARGHEIQRGFEVAASELDLADETGSTGGRGLQPTPDSGGHEGGSGQEQA